PALEKFRAPENRMITPEPNQFLGKGEELVLLGIVFPAEPAQLVIVAVGIIIPVLRPRPFIAGVEHRYTLGEKQGCEEIPPLPRSQSVDFWIVRGPFHPTVPGVVIVLAVMVVFAVAF